MQLTKPLLLLFVLVLSLQVGTLMHQWLQTHLRIHVKCLLSSRTLSACLC